jgi:hypothetical protein
VGNVADALSCLEIDSLKIQEEANSNLISNKCVNLIVMAIIPNRLQFTTFHPQANAIIERVQKVACCQ